MANDYENIQRLYEEGYRGQQFDPIKPPNAYPARQDWGPYSDIAYAIHSLGELRDHIISLSRGRRD